MEDKIKDIDKALNSLKRDEEQLIKELDKFNGKYEIENGKLTEPREVTEYKRELEKIRAEMEQKNLQRRRYVLLREKARLADENVVKNLKNMYRNEKNANQMINEMIEQRKQDIEFKLAEIENTIGPIDETEIENSNIDEVLKTMEERSKENIETKPVETINLEDLANRFENKAEKPEPGEIKVEEDIQPTEESEEPVQSELEELENEEHIQPEIEENEPENEEETKNTIINYMEQEIEKINEVLKRYENLEKNIDTLVSDFEEEKEKTDNLQSNFGKIKIDIDELSRRELIAETIKGLVITDLSRAKQEYEAYENESKENEEKLEKTKENIEDLDAECENTRKELEKAKNEEKEDKKKELIEKIESELKVFEKIIDFQKRNRLASVRWHEFYEKLPQKEDVEWKKMEDMIKMYDLKSPKLNLLVSKCKTKLNEIRNLVDVDLEKAYLEYCDYTKKDRIELSVIMDFELSEVMNYDENLPTSIERALSMAEEYAVNICKIEQEYMESIDKLKEEVEIIELEYNDLKSLPENKNEHIVALLENRLECARIWLKGANFSKKKEKIVSDWETFAGGTIEDLINSLEFNLSEEISASRAIEEEIEAAKKDINELLEKSKKQKNETEKTSKIENIEVENPPEIVDEDEEIEEYYEADDEEEYDDEEETIEEEPTIIDTNEETDAHQNGGKFLKGVGKVRKKNI